MKLLKQVLFGVAFTAIGFIVALMLQGTFRFDAKLSIDGLLGVVIAVIAVIGATIIVPMWVQPKLYSQRAIHKTLNQDVTLLASLVDELLDEYRELHGSQRILTVEDRQSMLAKHKKINNVARVVGLQKSKTATLDDFNERVYAPLTESNGTFSDDALPGDKLKESTYLAVKGVLDPVSYELQQLRYVLY